MKTSLNVSHLAYPVSSLGAGKRIALWVVGCPLDCNHCITPELQQESYGKIIEIDVLLQRVNKIVKSEKEKITGMTITGGEPFAQPEALRLFIEKIKKIYPQWDLLVFSGYTYQQLQKKEQTQRLLECIDILIDGPYVQSQAKQSRSVNAQQTLIASNNQKIHYLSQLGLKHQQQMHKQPMANLGLGQENKAWLIGIVNDSERAKIHKSL